MDAQYVAEKIVASLEEYGIEHDSEGILRKLEKDPDSIYDRLIDLAHEHEDDQVKAIRFLALAEIVVDYERANY